MQVFGGFFGLCKRTVHSPNCTLIMHQAKVCLDIEEKHALNMSMHRRKTSLRACLSRLVTANPWMEHCVCFSVNEALQWSRIIFGCLTKVQSTFCRLTNGAWAPLARSSACAYQSVTLSLLRRLTSIEQIRSESRAPVTRAAKVQQSRGGSAEHRKRNNRYTQVYSVSVYYWLQHKCWC